MRFRLFSCLMILILGVTTAQAADRGIAVRELAGQAGVAVGTYRALVIGINDYADERIPDLSTAVNDAQSVAELLRNSYGFSEVELLLNRKATDSNMIRALRRLANRSRPNDSVLIYYAGHGDLDKLTHDGYWIPANATAQDPSSYVDNGIIQKYVKAIPARHVLLVADSCFSGSLFGSARAMPSIIDDKYYANLYREKSRWGMTSGNLTPVSDSGSGGHSMFASQFIKALKRNEKPYITPREIYQEIAPVIANNSEQQPITKPIRNADDEGGEFIFIRSDGTATAASPAPAAQPASSGNSNMELAFWNSIKESHDPAMFRAYLQQYPHGSFAPLARLKAGGNQKMAMAARPRPVTTLPPAAPGEHRLTVEPDPADAEVRIMNIEPKYVPGIPLKPGNYHINVKRDGFE